MVTKEFIDQLNAEYHQLEMKQAQITHALFNRIFEIETGWYSGHFHENDNGGWNRDSYPIPVMSVKGICDIEIDFEAVSVSTKLKRKRALEYSYTEMSRYSFEAFGVEDYLCTFYKSGQTIEQLKSNITNSDEREIGFAFSFSFDVDEDTIYKFVKLLRREGFYY